MAQSNHRGEGEPPSNIHIGPATRKNSWLPWLLLALGLVALLFGIRRCQDSAATRIAPTPTTERAAGATAVPAPGTRAVTETVPVLPGTSAIGTYLGGTEPVPRTFVFEKLHFDTAKSDIRPQDHDELKTIVTVMKEHPNARVRIVGYADSRGTTPANANLGKNRADSVRSALAADGIAADRIETASGGETNPIATNATPAGQAENRRTELVVLQR